MGVVGPVTTPLEGKRGRCFAYNFVFQTVVVRSWNRRVQQCNAYPGPVPMIYYALFNVAFLMFLYSGNTPYRLPSKV